MEICGARIHRLESWHEPRLTFSSLGRAPDLEGFAFEQREKLFVAVNGRRGWFARSMTGRRPVSTRTGPDRHDA